MKKKVKVTILILNWNGEKLLKDNLPSVLEQTYPDFNVLLVDNGSKDTSKKVMQEFVKKDKRIELIDTGKNLGYVGGNNFGMKKILEEGRSDYIVILNNDVRVSKNWLENLIDGFKDNKVGICSSKVLLYYPFMKIKLTPLESDIHLKDIKINNLSYFILVYDKQFTHGGKFVQLPKMLKHRKTYCFAVPCDFSNTKQVNLVFRGGKLKIQSPTQEFILEKSGSRILDSEEEYIMQNAGSSLNKSRMTFDERYHLYFDHSLKSEYVDAACGASMAIRGDLLNELGLLREKYFMYYEDGELSYRFKKHGYRSKFIHNAVCYHYYRGSHEGKLLPKHIFHGVKNKLWFTRRYFGFFSYLLFSIKAIGRSCILLLQIPFKKGAKGSFWAYIRALTCSLSKDV